LVKIENGILIELGDHGAFRLRLAAATCCRTHSHPGRKKEKEPVPAAGHCLRNGLFSADVTVLYGQLACLNERNNSSQ